MAQIMMSAQTTKSLGAKPKTSKTDVVAPGNKVETDVGRGR
jgi:hypothetical protein